MKYSPRCQIVFSISLVTVILLFHGTALSENPLPKLPDIGDPAAAVLPLSKEQKLGKIFVRELRAKLPLISDIEINEYLASLGTQLSNVAESPLEFHFLLAKNSQINAFATLGGVITVNSGLWLKMEQESELAGVLAHEIAHVTQRHLARFLTESNRFSWANALALLSVILAATYDSDLGRLGLHTSLSIPLEQRLSYIRNHEREADNLAIRIMAKTGFHPDGLTDFFQALQDHSANADQVPEFLRTHPLTLNRLSDAANRIAQYRGNYRRDSQEFQYAKARLYALGYPAAVLKEQASNDPVDIYRKAIALTRSNRTDEALNLLEELSIKNNNLAIKLALAQAKIVQGNYSGAHSQLEKLNELYPYRETISYYYALSLLKLKKYAAAKNILNTVTLYGAYNPLIDKLRAEISAAQNEDWASHEYMANYYEATGHLDDALKQLDKALAAKVGGEIFLLRIEEKRKQIEKLKAEAKDPLK